MKRKDYIDKIIKYNALFVQEVKSYNAINNYDINIHAENALIPILNSIFDIQLINANQKKKNFPAVDLIDEKNRIAFQISATCSTTKITSTLDRFFERNLDQQFDTLYFIGITEKDTNLSAAKINGAVKSGFMFNIEEHILDSNDIIKKINYIQAIERLETISRIYEHEFSDVQIKSREKKFKEGFLGNDPEEIFLNLLEVVYRPTLFIADLQLDPGRIKQEINDLRVLRKRRKMRFFTAADLVRHELQKRDTFIGDWITRENKIISFHDLSNSSDPLRFLVDKATIEEIRSEEYLSTNSDYLNNFKDLLKKSLIEMCRGKQMEYMRNRQILRFKNNREVPNQKKIRWKGKNEATKTVIFEMMSKKKGEEDPHIICYRSMAFRPDFHFLANKWYVTINPTWSFTNPGGYQESRFESSYMTGLKRQENNSTVYYQFRFFAYYLSYSDLFTESYPFLKVVPMKPIEFNPKIVDSKWLPPKESSPSNSKEAELQIDNELNSALF